LSDKELDETLKKLADIFYQQYIKELKSGKLNSSTEKVISKIK